jgi:hypothetical protein
LLLSPNGVPFDIDTTLVALNEQNGLTYATIYQLLLTASSIPDEYAVIADCIYSLSAEFLIPSRTRYANPMWGTAIAIAPHFLLAAGHSAHWLTKFRGRIVPEGTSLVYAPCRGFVANKRFSLRAGQDFELEIDRDDIFEDGSEDDFSLVVYAFANGRPADEVYVVENPDDTSSETDIMVLYSAQPLPHASYPRPAKSRPSPYRSTQISLLAYQGDETSSVYEDYPYTTSSDLDAALDSIITDRLSLVKGVTGSRSDPHFIYHRCSSTAGSSGGALANENGELVGMSSCVSFFLMIGVHIEGEYNEEGVVDWTCENIGIALDSPALKNFIEFTVLPIVAPENQEAWRALIS